MEALTHTPSSHVHLLASLGRHVHASALRVLYGTLVISDDMRIFEPSASFHRRLIAPMFANPERYARAVKSLVVQPPLPDAFGPVPPLDSHRLTLILSDCVNLEEVVWKSSLAPPDNLCEVRSCLLLNKEMPKPQNVDFILSQSSPEPFSLLRNLQFPST